MKNCVAVDARWIQNGIGTYILNVLSGVKPYGNGFVTRALLRRQDVAKVRPLCDDFTIVDLPIYTLREQFEIPFAARDAALLHATHYNAPLMFPRRLLVTIHDLIHVVDATARRRPASWLYARPMLNLAARRALHIIAVSEYSKAQIVERLGIPPAKVTVIHNGVHPRFNRRSREGISANGVEKLTQGRPFLLYIGTLKPHKNLMTLLSAFALLRERGMRDCLLLVVGDDKLWKPELDRQCSRLGIAEEVRFFPQVSEELLPHIYSAAELLVLPSFIEGFGLPVVEAMACGTPVVCSRAASLPEIAGDAAAFFDPSSAEDLAATIQRLLESPSLRTAYCEKGLRRAALFSWDQCARRHCDLYRELLRA